MIVGDLITGIIIILINQVIIIMISMKTIITKVIIKTSILLYINNSDIYQLYNLIREAKTRCYPPKEEAYKITEYLTEIYLQELIDRSMAFRIIQCQWSVIDSFSTENITSMT
jgi:hypothetical protein